MNIIQGLRTSLDADKGGDIAANLDSLYEYMGADCWRLMSVMIQLLLMK